MLWFRNFLSGKFTRVILAFILFLVVVSTGIYFWQKPVVLSQRNIESLVPVTMPSKGQRVLVISPHADDETIAAGGFIIQSVRNGADVRVILVTDCNMHHNEDMRYTEFKKVTGILGVRFDNLVFLGFPDGKLHQIDSNIVFQKLKEQVDAYHPDIILYPDPNDMHLDHATTGVLIQQILRGEDTRPRAYQYLVHYKLLYPEPRKFDPKLYLLPPKSLVTDDIEWQRLDLPPDIEDTKKSAAFSYISQLRNFEIKDLILSSIRKNELFSSPKE
jgi:N-acetylglucosamine malate deacetylase 1